MNNTQLHLAAGQPPNGNARTTATRHRRQRPDDPDAAPWAIKNAGTLIGIGVAGSLLIVLLGIFVLPGPWGSARVALSETDAARLRPAERVAYNRALAEAEDAVRASSIKLAAGFATIVGALVGAGRLQLLRREDLRAGREHVTTRFSKAVEQLGHTAIDISIGGVYALEAVAKDSETYRPIVFEVLAAFVRGNAGVIDTDEPASRNQPIHVQAALTVLGRLRAIPPDKPISLSTSGGTDLRCADLSDAILNGANLGKVVLRSSNLDGAHLRLANLADADLTDASLRGTNLAEAKLVNAHLEGASLLQANLERAQARSAILRKAHLRRANLAGAHFGWADLKEAILRRADLHGAYFGGADLSGADFRGADLTTANLSGANLQGADLTNANLSAADLEGADLTGASLSGAILTEVSLGTAVLTDATASQETSWPVGFDPNLFGIKSAHGDTLGR